MPNISPLQIEHNTPVTLVTAGALSGGTSSGTAPEPGFPTEAKVLGEDEVETSVGVVDDVLISPPSDAQLNLPVGAWYYIFSLGGRLMIGDPTGQVALSGGTARETNISGEGFFLVKTGANQWDVMQGLTPQQAEELGSLIASWYAEDASGTSQPDRTANGYDAVATGATLSSGVWNFDGANDYLTAAGVPDTTFAGADNQFSISVRAAVVNNGEESTLAAKFNEQGGFEFIFYVKSSNGALTFVYYMDGVGYGQRRQIITSNSGYFDGVEREYTVTYDGSIDTTDGLDRVQLYVDGVLEASVMNISVGALGDILETTEDFTMGGYPDTASPGDIAGDLQGTIRRVNVYSEIIDATAAADLAAETF